MSNSKNHKKSLQKTVRKQKGVFYTQKEIARYMSRKSIDYWLEENETNKGKLKNVRILDPSCGAGIFLMECFDYLVELNQKEFPNSLAIESEIVENNLFGVYIDEKAISLSNFKEVLIFIISNSFLKAGYGTSLRNLISDNIIFYNLLITTE